MLLAIHPQDMPSLMAHVVEEGHQLEDEDMRKLLFGDYFHNSGPKVYSEIQVKASLNCNTGQTLASMSLDYLRTAAQPLLHTAQITQ